MRHDLAPCPACHIYHCTVCGCHRTTDRTTIATPIANRSHNR